MRGVAGKIRTPARGRRSSVAVTPGSAQRLRRHLRHAEAVAPALRSVARKGHRARRDDRREQQPSCPHDVVLQRWMSESSVNAAPRAGCRSRSDLSVGAGQQPAWDSPHYLELPADPDDPEEPEAPAEPDALAPPSPPALLRGSVVAFFLLVGFAVVLASVTLALVSVEALIDELLLGAVVVEDVLGVELYVDCDVWLLLELWMAELLIPLVLLLGEV